MMAAASRNYGKSATKQQAANIREVFGVMSSRWIFLDYKPLEYLINKFSLEEVREKLEQYKKKLQQAIRDATQATS